jgi:hypothetical protein
VAVEDAVGASGPMIKPRDTRRQERPRARMRMPRWMPARNDLWMIILLGTSALALVVLGLTLSGRLLGRL